MHVAIAGAHGQVARRLGRLLSARGDRVTGIVRNPDHAADVTADGAARLVLDLERTDPEAVAAELSGVDAVVFSAGAGPGSGDARKQTVDHGAAVLLGDAALAAEHDLLARDGLTLTVLRPGGLTDSPGTGRVTLAASAPRGQVPRDDVAAVLVALLDVPATAGLVLELVGGDVPVADAVAAAVGPLGGPSSG